MKKGFTMFENDILEALLKSDFNCTEIKIVMAAVRLSSGYQKDECMLKYEYLAKITGRTVRMVTSALKGLCAKNVIHRKSTGLYTVMPPSSWGNGNTVPPDDEMQFQNEVNSVSRNNKYKYNKYKLYNKNKYKRDERGSENKIYVPTPKRTAFGKFCPPSGINYAEFEMKALKSRMERYKNTDDKLT